MSNILARMSINTLGVVLIVTSAYAAPNQVEVKSQRVTNNEVTVASVTAAEDALIVIFPRNEAGEPDTTKALGQAPVKAGESTNVKVLLEHPVTPGSRLVAVLYADAGEKGKFEPGIDTPIVRPVSNNFKVK